MVAYYYDKYNTTTMYGNGADISHGTANGAFANLTLAQAIQRVTTATLPASFYTTLNLNTDTGVYTLGGTSIAGTATLSSMLASGSGSTIVRYFRATGTGLGSGYGRAIITASSSNPGNYSVSVIFYTIVANYFRGTLVQSNLIAEDGLYPVEGRHTDGFWYVRKTVANNKPTISITSPSNNQTLYENDTININGIANDPDKDQSVTVYYQINSEPKKVLATNISQTQIPLSKQLTFKSGKLYDGDTAITVILADGVAHTLKVWAEDSEKASSDIIERTFYVVPNRAPLLTVDSVVPSGVVDTDKFKINGTSSDLDANANVTVTRRINAGNAVEIYNGPGGAWEFEISLAQLVVGVNTIVIEVIDNYGAKTSKTIKLNKSEVKTPILQSVVRYKIEPPKGSAKGVLLWIQRDEGLELSAELSMTLKGEQESYVPLIATNTAPVSQGIVEDEFYHETLEPKENIILKISMLRFSTTVNNKINLISGVLE